MVSVVVAQAALCNAADNEAWEFEAMPKPKEVNYGRDNKVVYTWFCKHFMEAVVGTVKWNKNKANLPLRKFAPPSDEAFAMIVYQNNYNKWYHQFKSNNDKDQTVPAEWTNGGNSKGQGSKTKKFCGWARAGLEQMNSNYLKVQKDRAENPRFDQALLEYYQATTKRPKRVRNNTANKENEFTGFQLMNSLPLEETSDNDDDDSVVDGSTSEIVGV